MTTLSPSIQNVLDGYAPACTSCATPFQRQQVVTQGHDPYFVCVLCGTVHAPGDGGIRRIPEAEYRREVSDPRSNLSQTLRLRRAMLECGEEALYEPTVYVNGRECRRFDARSESFALLTLQTLAENSGADRVRRTSHGLSFRQGGSQITLEIEPCRNRP